MTKEEFVNNIFKNIYGNETVRKELFYYLINKNTKIPDIKKLYLSSLGDYGTCIFNDNYIKYHNLENIKDELKEIVKKLLNLFIEYNPEELIKNYSHAYGRYEYYKLINADIDFVKKDFQYIVYSVISNNNLFEFKQSMLNDCIKEVDKHYENLIYEIISDYQNYDKYFGIILLIKKISYRDIKYMKFVKELEKIVYSILKLNFDCKKIEDIFNNYIDDEVSKQYYNSFMPIDISEKNIEDLLFMICNMCLGISNKIDTAIKISYILFNYEFVYFEMNTSKKDDFYWNIFNTLNLPNETAIKYCVAANIYDYENRNHFDRMYNILNKNHEDFKYVLDEFISQNEIYSCVLLAYMLKKDKLDNIEKQYYIEKTENIIIKFISTKTKYDNKELFYLYEDKGYTYESFKEIDFPCNYDTEKFGFLKDDLNILKKLIKMCSFILDYSRVSRNVLKYILVNSPHYTNLVNYFKNYEEFCYNKNMSTYDKFYKMGFSIFSITNIFLKEGEENKEEFIKFLKKHKQEAGEGITKFNFDDTADTIIKYINLLYKEDNGFDIKYVVKAFDIKLKPVSEYVEKFLISKEKEARVYVESLLKSKNKISADSAMRLIKIWDNEHIENKLKEIKDLNTLTEYINNIYSENNKKNIPYEKEVDYGNVRSTDSEEKVSEIIVKYYISEYIMIKELYINNICKKIEEFINIYDFRKLVKNIFEMWISDNYKAKYKNIIIPFVITASENQIAEIKKQIDFWCNNGKPSIAAFTVKVLGFNKSKISLLTIDMLSRKYKNKKVKSAALEAINTALKEFNISKDEFEDLIIPNLGFGKDRKRIFDYGERKFIAILNENLEIILFDSDGNLIKSLPRISSKYNDNENMVNLCKDDFKLIKKQVKSIFEIQQIRISTAVFLGRKWNIDKWKELFVENPIMINFAVKLIWQELDTKGNLIGTFRYMEDGSFNSIDEEEYILTENSFISLLHPSDIDEEELKQWKQQLEDYEILQPIEQINIPVYKLKKEDILKKEITCFEDKKIYNAVFKSIANKWQMQLYYDDTGECDGCGFKYNDIIMLIYVKPFYTDDYKGETCLKKIVFFKEKENNILKLNEVSLKLLSFAVYISNLMIRK